MVPITAQIHPYQSISYTRQKQTTHKNKNVQQHNSLNLATNAMTAHTKITFSIKLVSQINLYSRIYIDRMID